MREDFPTTILLATDGSADAALAARASADLSKATGAELHFVHAWRVGAGPRLEAYPAKQNETLVHGSKGKSKRQRAWASASLAHI